MDVLHERFLLHDTVRLGVSVGNIAATTTGIIHLKTACFSTFDVECDCTITMAKILVDVKVLFGVLSSPYMSL